MFARYITATKHREPDITWRARTCLTLTGHVRHGIKLNRAPTGRRLAKRQRGAGRGVNLVVVMRLKNLNVPPLDKLCRDLLDKLGQQRDANRCIGTINKRDGVRRRRQCGLVIT